MTAAKRTLGKMLRIWMRGLIGAFIGGLGNGITVMLMKPEDFNFATGWPDLWHFSLISAVISAGLYLKTHPVPAVEADDETTSSEPEAKKHHEN